jgi:AcrR family transcriptional regulator
MNDETTPAPRRTQADRRATTRRALLDAAAIGLARDGYGGLVLEKVASDAGFTRGALYHQFADKEALALAAIARNDRSWRREVGMRAAQAAVDAGPVAALAALARGHAVFCRRDVAQILMSLRVEFHGQDHPVGNVVNEIVNAGIDFIASLIGAAREVGAISGDIPDRVLALAYFGALEGAAIQLARHPKYDELLAERVALGALGLTAP